MLKKLHLIFSLNIVWIKFQHSRNVLWIEAIHAVQSSDCFLLLVAF